MGFGSLINSGAQNALTSLQQGVNTLGGQMQYQEANQQAAALENEAGNVFEQSQIEAQRAEIQGTQFAGQQAETFAGAGVEIGGGSPVANLRQTMMQTNQQVQLLQQQGKLQQNLLMTQANQVQDQGLSAIIGAAGENQLATQQNDLTQAQEKDQLEEQFWGGLLGFGSHLLGDAMPSILKQLMGSGAAPVGGGGGSIVP
jgi:hypothetical protein